MKKALLKLFLMLVVILCLFTTTAFAAGGSCGVGVKYDYDSSTGTLQIYADSGSGVMKDYTKTSRAPWYTDRSSIKWIVVENSVSHIGDYAFYGCSNVTKVSLGRYLKSIGEGAFYNCSSDSVSFESLPTYLETIEDFAFYGCKVYSSISIPAATTSIGSRAFENFAAKSFSVAAGNPNYKSSNGLLLSKDGTELIAYPHAATSTTFTIPATLEKIGPYAFGTNSTLTKVNMDISGNDQLIEIGEGAFSACTALATVTLPASLKLIKQNAFSCSTLTSAKYEGTEAVWDDWVTAESGNTNLTNILTYGTMNHPYHPLCGEVCTCTHTTHKPIQWVAWNGTNRISSGGSYLIGDVTRESQYSITGSVNLCLNDHSIVTNGKYAGFEIKSTGGLTVTDCGTNGTISSVSNNTSSSERGIENRGGHFSLYNGTIIGGETGIHDNFNAVDGNITCTSNTAIYGGTVTGHNITAFESFGSTTIHGGVFDGEFSASGETTINGGTFLDTVWNSGTMTLNDATIAVDTYDYLQCGILNQGTMTIEDVDISFVGEGYGDAVCNDGTLHLSGGTFPAVTRPINGGTRQHFSLVSCHPDARCYISGKPSLTALEVDYPNTVVFASEDGTKTYSGTNDLKIYVDPYYFGNAGVVASGVNSSLYKKISQIDLEGSSSSSYLYGDLSLEGSNLMFSKQISSIALTTRPSKLGYVEGTKLDTTGGKITVYYEDESTDLLDLTADMVSGFDSSKIGNQTLTVTYKGFTTTFDVSVGAKSITRIAMENLPVTRQYLEGKDTLDVTGGTITVYYNNSTSEEIALTEDMVSGFDNTRVGTQWLTVTYKVSTTSFSVTVVAKTPTGMEISVLPEKLTYLEGKDPLDVAGGTLFVTYNNDTSGKINMTADMVSGFDNTVVGSQTLTVTYGGYTDTFDVFITEKSLCGIEVTTLPTKTKYIRNEEELDLSGAVLTLFYDNDSTEDIPLTKDLVSKINHSATGQQPIAVFYEGGFYTTFQIVVVDRTSIAVSTPPSQLTYLEGEIPDLSDGKLTVNYSDGSSETIPLDQAAIAYDKNSVGATSITVTYKGLSATFVVEFLGKTPVSIDVTAPRKVSYLEGKDVLDVTDGKVTIHYNNGTSKTVDLTTEMVSGFDNTTVGKQTLTVTYSEFTASFEITIVAKAVSSIAVTTLPNTLVFIEGTALDVTGGKITVHYNNDTSGVLDLATGMISGFDNATVGNQTLTVTYDGKTTSYAIEVVEKSAVSIAVTTLPARLTYIEGKIPLDTASGKITVRYNNNTSEVLDLTASMVSGFDNTIVGNQTLTVTYLGLQTSFDITISPRVIQSIQLKAPQTLEYLQGSPMDLFGGYLTVVYVSDDNYTEVIPLDNSMISGYNPENAGVQVVFVTYEGKTTNFAVRVTAKTATSAVITALPDKLVYTEGEVLDVTGGKITVFYNNETSEEIDLTASMISGFDNSVVGRQTLTVSCAGFTDTFDVEIVVKVEFSLISVSDDCAQILLKNNAPGKCFVAIYNESKQMLTCGLREIPADVGEVTISYAPIAYSNEYITKVFLTNLETTPVNMSVLD